MAKKKNKKTKISTNANNSKNTKVVKVQTKPKTEQKQEAKVEPQVKEQLPKSNGFKTAFVAVGKFFKKIANGIKKLFVKAGLFFKKCFMGIKTFISKSVIVWNFIKKHKKVFGCMFALLYTVVIVFSTLGIEHYVLPHVVPVSVETEQTETAEVQQFKMEQGQVYRVSPDSVLQYEGYEFTSTIRPKNVEKAGEYFGQSYVNENEDNIYLDIVFKYTNKSSQSVRGDQIMSVITTVENKSYEDIFTAIENKDGTNIDFSSAVEIAPGDYALVHSVFDVPKETQDMTDIKSEVVADGKSYVISIGDESESEPTVEQPDPDRTQRQALTK